MSAVRGPATYAAPGRLGRRDTLRAMLIRRRNSLTLVTLWLLVMGVVACGSPLRTAACGLNTYGNVIQEQLQARHMGRAEYVVAGEDGPDHQKLFTVDVVIDGNRVAQGAGLTKKAAEQAAARHALQHVWAGLEKSSEALTKNG